jgi:hypothetical protein
MHLVIYDVHCDCLKLVYSLGDHINKIKLHTQYSLIQIKQLPCSDCLNFSKIIQIRRDMFAVRYKVSKLYIGNSVVSEKNTARMKTKRQIKTVI